MRKSSQADNRNKNALSEMNFRDRQGGWCHYGEKVYGEETGEKQWFVFTKGG